MTQSETLLLRPVKRGCGKRQKGGLYACVPTSLGGLPIKRFIFDPPRRWDWPAFRAPILLPHAPQEPADIAVWIGAEHYPFVPDFIEEAHRYGVSRRIPPDFPIDRLGYGSRMLLVHPRAIPTFDHETLPSPHCQWRNVPHHNLPSCTFALWDLSALEDRDEKHAVSLVKGDKARIEIPCGRVYTVNQPLKPKEAIAELPYRPGIFAWFYLNHFEYVGEGVPDTIAQRAATAGLGVHAVEE